MIVLRSFLLLVEVLCSVLLIGLILLQRSKSEGLGAAFGGGMGESLFGSRAGNVLTKMTVILGSVFLVNTLALGILYAGGTATRSPISRGLLEEPAVQHSEGTEQGADLSDILRQLDPMPATQDEIGIDPPLDVSDVPETMEQPVPETEEGEMQDGNGDTDEADEAEQEL